MYLIELVEFSIVGVEERKGRNGTQAKRKHSPKENEATTFSALTFTFTFRLRGHFHDILTTVTKSSMNYRSIT